MKEKIKGVAKTLALICCAIAINTFVTSTKTFKKVQAEISQFVQSQSLMNRAENLGKRVQKTTNQITKTFN